MDCRTCKHNTYIGSVDDWVSCSHPTTLEKTPRPEKGDPAWVNAMTTDLRVSRMDDYGDIFSKCPTFEAAKAPRTE